MSLRVTPAPDAAGEVDRLIQNDPELGLERHGAFGKSTAEVYSDPFCLPESRFLAYAEGELAGFGYGFVLPSFKETWSYLRVGVARPHRRRGIGSALLASSRAAIIDARPEVGEVCFGADESNVMAAGFAGRHGFRPVRRAWQMEIPETHADRTSDPAWPERIEPRVFDGSDAAFEDWNDSYNAAFESLYHGVRSTVRDCRGIAALPSFAADGLLLAYRGRDCVGFCRNRVWEGVGEIAVLGVVPSGQRLGLGRALLRWGVRWQRGRGIRRTTLGVDGQNDRALELYRSEHFEVVRTRQLWAHPAPQNVP